MIGQSFGVDLSHNNSPDFAALAAARTSFAYVRACYGSGLRDRRAVEFCANLRELGIPLGLYHFYRSHQSVEAQLALFCDVAKAVGYGPGDLVPALDIEFDPSPKPGRHPTKAWDEPCRRFVLALEARFGGCLIYIRGDEWQAMGSPAWVLERPLWVPRYTNATTTPPSIGGSAPLIWQRRVGVLDPDGPGVHQEGPKALDHNYAFGEIPRCTYAGVIAPPPVEEDEDDAAFASMRGQLDAAFVNASRDATGPSARDLDGDSDAPPPGGVA